MMFKRVFYSKHVTQKKKQWLEGAVIFRRPHTFELHDVAHDDVGVERVWPSIKTLEKSKPLASAYASVHSGHQPRSLADSQFDGYLIDEQDARWEELHSFSKSAHTVADSQLISVKDSNQREVNEPPYRMDQRESQWTVDSSCTENEDTLCLKQPGAAHQVSEFSKLNILNKSTSSKVVSLDRASAKPISGNDSIDFSSFV